jgi:hypothetical protein
MSSSDSRSPVGQAGPGAEAATFRIAIGLSPKSSVSRTGCVVQPRLIVTGLAKRPRRPSFAFPTAHAVWDTLPAIRRTHTLPPCLSDAVSPGPALPGDDQFEAATCL